MPTTGGEVSPARPLVRTLRRTDRTFDVQAVRALLAVARSGSIGAAGRELGISQQAVSSRLAVLERSVGTELVTRGARGSDLTATGALIAEWGGPVLAAADHLVAGIAALRFTPGALRVAADPAVAGHLLPRWLARLRGASTPPGVVHDVRLVHGDCTVDELVRSGGTELAFVLGQRDLTGLDTRLVGSARMALVVSPRHPWSRRTEGITPERLAATALVTTTSGSPDRQFVDSALRKAVSGWVTRPRPLRELDHYQAVRDAVIGGIGPAVVPTFAVADDLAHRRLHRVPLLDLDMRLEIRAIWRTGSSPGHTAESLVAVAEETEANTIP